MSAPSKPEYRTNWKTYNSALKGRGSLFIWLDHDMCGHCSAKGQTWAQPYVQPSGDPILRDHQGAVQPALRQAMGMAQSLLKLAALDWKVPDFNTVSRRQKHLAVTITANPTNT